MSRFSILLLALALPLAACGSDEPDASGSIADAAESVEALPASGGPGERPTVSGATVVDVVAEAPELTTLRRLLRESGMAETLVAEGPYTLFAPSDDAFAAAGLGSLTEDPEALRAVLSAHVLPFRMMSADLDFEQTVENVGGTQLSILPGSPPAVASGGVRASVVRADLDAANGVVHVIDAVLPAQ